MIESGFLKSSGSIFLPYRPNVHDFVHDFLSAESLEFLVEYVGYVLPHSRSHFVISQQVFSIITFL